MGSVAGDWAAHPVVRSLPHALTLSRVLLVALGYYVLFTGPKGLLVAVILVAVLTDIVDGPLARRLGVDGKLGADLDSVADFVLYTSLLVWAYVLQPQVMVPQTPLVAAIFMAYVAALLLGRYRRGVIGFHNRWSRLSSSFGVAYAIYVVAWGWNTVLFWLLLLSVVADLWQRARGILGIPPKDRPWHVD